MANKPIQQTVYQLLEELGEDPNREGLQATWQRRVPQLLEELTAGYDEDQKPEMRTFSESHEEMIAKTDIPFYSLCEHHLLPFSGTAHIAYMPNGEIVGLSKLIRYTQWVAKRLQTQERLTATIADGLMDELDARGVMVITAAEHMCEAMRGVETPDTTTTITADRGEFTDPPEGQNPRKEFLTMVHG